MLLSNVAQVKEALGDSLTGNIVSDCRIDGWSGGSWLEGPSRKQLGVLDSSELSLFSALKDRTLSMNLEDGSVSASRHMDAMIGAVCQSNGNVAQQCTKVTKSS